MNVSVRMIHKVSLNPDFLCFKRFLAGNFAGNDRTYTYRCFRVFRGMSMSAK